MSRISKITLSIASVFLLQCATPQERATLEVKDHIRADLAALTSAAREMQSVTPAQGPWSPSTHSSDVARMRAAWLRARAAYERVEGAVAVLFPELDVSTDARFDHFVSERPDTNLFDGEGVTGMHAIERILWADQIPERVRAFEATLPNSPQAARAPMTATEAQQFRSDLLGRLIRDSEEMERQFRPLALDNATAFRGVIGSLEEQLEKVNVAATGEEESRYAQTTLADMRSNLEGSQRTFRAFRPWLESVQQQALATRIDARFAALSAQYTALQGDALPPVPEGYNPTTPSAAHLATPYGQLRSFLQRESDPMQSESLVALMSTAADALNIPQLR